MQSVRSTKKAILLAGRVLIKAGPRSTIAAPCIGTCEGGGGEGSEVHFNRPLQGGNKNPRWDDAPVVAL